MVDVEYSRSFEKAIRKNKDASLKNHIKYQIEKIINAPEVGKPLRYNLKGERTIIMVLLILVVYV